MANELEKYLKVEISVEKVSEMVKIWIVKVI